MSGTGVAEPSIRFARREDLPSLIRIAKSSPSAAQWSAASWEQVFDPAAPHRVVLVAEQLSEVVGFAVLFAATHDWELENIVSDAALRRRGIAKTLLHAAIDQAAGSGAESIILEVRESNHPARALYERCGFRQTGRRPGYYDHPAEAAILYACQVSASR